MRKKQFCSLLAAAALMPALAAAEPVIAVSADPALPAVNLLRNPSFESGDGVVDDWAFAEHSSYFRWTREYLYMSEFAKLHGMAFDGMHYLRQRTNYDSILTEMFIRQMVPVRPMTTYRASIRARIHHGMANLHILADPAQPYKAPYAGVRSWERTPLTEFLDMSYLRGPAPEEWVELSLTFRTTALEDLVAFDFGSYVGRAQIDFDAADLRAAATDISIRVTYPGDVHVTVYGDADPEKPVWTAPFWRPAADGAVFLAPQLSTDQNYTIKVINSDKEEFTVCYPAE